MKVNKTDKRDKKETEDKTYNKNNHSGNLGIYIHIPFCEQKCNYCGFLSFPSDRETRKKYTEALCRKISKWGNEVTEDYKVDTVFIGGGTPSLLEPSEITAVTDSLKQSFLFTEDPEITIESNPNSLTDEKLVSYRKAGINRLSIGVQSMDNGVLKTLGRIHTDRQAEDAFYRARKAGFDNINLDLMFAISGQTDTVFEDTLRKVTDMGPEHISFYSLQIEEGTKFYEDYKNEKYEFITDEQMNRMYLKASSFLKERGYEKYEISNASKPGFACRHNLKYWSMEPFLGIGLGASGYFDDYRYQETGDFDRWINESLDDRSEFQRVKESCSRESAEDKISTYVITGMRRTEGIMLKDFQARFGLTFEEKYGELYPYLREETEKGNLIAEKGRLAFTDKGMLVSNDILCEFV